MLNFYILYHFLFARFLRSTNGQEQLCENALQRHQMYSPACINARDWGLMELLVGKSLCKTTVQSPLDKKCMKH